jgi:hypothetical protein
MHKRDIAGKVDPSYYDNLTREPAIIVLQFLHQAEEGGGAHQ